MKRKNYRSKEERHCKLCGKPFYPWPQNVRKGSGIYCSRTCSDLDRGIVARADCSYLDSLSVEELAYFAGFLDGEGCITLRSDKWGVILHIANTNTEILNWIKSKFGGTVHPCRPNGPRCKPISYWHCPSFLATQILKRIKHLLIVKKEQAEIVISYIQNRVGVDYAQRLAVKKKLHDLNRRGISCDG